MHKAEMAFDMSTIGANVTSDPDFRPRPRLRPLTLIVFGVFVRLRTGLTFVMNARPFQLP